MPAPKADGTWPRAAGGDSVQMSAVSITISASVKASRFIKTRAGATAVMVAAIAAGHAPTSRTPALKMSATANTPLRDVMRRAVRIGSSSQRCMTARTQMNAGAFQSSCVASHSVSADGDSARRTAQRA